MPRCARLLRRPPPRKRTLVFDGLESAPTEFQCEPSRDRQGGFPETGKYPWFTVKLAAAVLVPPGVVAGIGPLVALAGTVAQT